MHWEIHPPRPSRFPSGFALGQSLGPRGAKSPPSGNLSGLGGCISQYIPPLGSVRIHYTSWQNCNTLKQRIFWGYKFWNLVEIQKFGWHPEIWLKSLNLVNILKLWTNLEILKFGQNFEICLFSWDLVEILKFGNFLISWNLVKILKFCKILDIWLISWNLVKILKFGWNSEIW